MEYGSAERALLRGREVYEGQKKKTAVAKMVTVATATVGTIPAIYQWVP